MTIPQFRDKYENEKMENGTFLEDVSVALTGRIMGSRASGNKLVFIDLSEDNGKIQVFATASNYKEDFEIVST